MLGNLGEFLCFLHMFILYQVLRTCRNVMWRPGWYARAWSSWHLHVVSLHLNSWTSLSVSIAFCILRSISVSERSGRQKPPADRIASYLSFIARVPGNQFYCSPGTHRLVHTAAIMSYYCRCVSGVAVVEPVHCSMFPILRRQPLGLSRCSHMDVLHLRPAYQ